MVFLLGQRSPTQRQHNTPHHGTTSFIMGNTGHLIRICEAIVMVVVNGLLRYGK